MGSYAVLYARLNSASMLLGALLFLLTCGTCGQSAPRLANTSGWQQTPYERNPSLFANEQEAVQALGSPDILMRRSGVQWLGQWTGTVHGVAPNQANWAVLQRQTPLIPRLIRAVREMPDADSQQAARLIAVIGEAGRSGIPTLCAEIVSPDYGDGTPEGVKDITASIDLATSLTLLCGGPDSVSMCLTPLLRNPNPETRRAVAGTLGFRTDLLANRRLGDYDEYSLPLEARRRRNFLFDRHAIPALALCLDDPVTAVRLTAAHSLETLTYNSGEAPWQEALPPLARALASPDPILRRTAARTLALMPTDTAPVAVALRNALHGRDEAIYPYVITALSHAAWCDPGETLDAFLPDLKALDLERRRLAAADVHRAEGALWSNRRQAGYEAMPDEHGNINNGYDSRQMTWSLDVDEGIPLTQRAAVADRRRVAAVTARTRFLAALVQATSDPDHAVRTEDALSLESIGRWTYNGLENGYTPNPAAEARPQVITALGQASDALRTSEPLLSSNLRDLQARVTRGPDGAA